MALARVCTRDRTIRHSYLDNSNWLLSPRSPSIMELEVKAEKPLIGDQLITCLTQLRQACG